MNEMLLTYLKSACNNLLRHASHTVITLLGLVLGMTSCILIMLYVLDELSFDRWLPEAASVYRLELQTTDPSGNERLIRKSALRARRDLLEYFPEIEAATRIIDEPVTLSSGDAGKLETAWFVDRDFFDVFQLELLSGGAGALDDKSSVVISAALAEEYFQGTSPLGRLLAMNDAREYRVAGVFADMPRNSHVHFNLVVPFDETDPVFNFAYSESWGAIEGYTYLKLAAGSDERAIAERLPAFLQNYSAAQSGATVPPPRLRLLNVLDIHLDAGGIGNIQPPGNKQSLITLSAIALLVLTIASINFVNLSTVRSLDRAREVSIRKAVGALRRNLVAQFLCESVLVALVALVVSASLVELGLPVYSALLGRALDIHYLSFAPVIVFVLAVVLGIATGLLPAYRLASWQPATILRSGAGGGGQGRAWLQAVLVTTQFAISATLVMTTLVILLQQAFIDGKDLGYVPEHKLVIRNLGEDFIVQDRDLLAAQIVALSAVSGTAFAAATPGDMNGAGFFRVVTVPGFSDTPLQVYPKAIDANFLDVYGVALLAGRNFSADLAGDRFVWPSAPDAPETRATAILNLAAVQAAGFAGADDALGKIIRMQSVELTVIGVVPDINFQSLRTAVTPNMYINSPADFPTLTVAYADGTDEQALLADVMQIWDSLAPEAPLAFDFVDDNIAAQYAQDRRQFLLITVFSTLAISIACLGLYALAAWSTRRRTREIGIRKVHGALSSDIVRLLLLQFSRPVLLANFVAWPVAWYVMDGYLDGFAYRIDLGPAVFVAASLMTAAIAWSAIVLRVINAAAAPPVLALRYE